MLWWWRIVVAVVALLLHVATSEHLSKEFASARKEAARSMESEKAGPTGMGADFDVGAILCEKYADWSQWSACSRKCEQTRGRQCRVPEECGKSWVKEKRTCTWENGACTTLSYKVIGLQKRNRLIEELLYDLLYSSWTPWGSCSRSCRQRRQRKCKYKAICIRSYIQEERRCQVAGSECEHRFSLKPLGLGKDYVQSNNETTSASENTENTEDDISYGGDENAEADYSTIPEKGGANAEGEHFSLLSIAKDPENKQDEYRGTDRVHGHSHGRRRTMDKSGDEESQHKRKERKDATLEEELTGAQKQCGIRPRLAFGTYRVVGGQEVQKNSWPWQVAILTKFHEQYCGGTLISPRWVLTAAHCVRKKGKRRKLVVRIGEHDIGEYEPSQEDIRSEQEFPHPEFDYHTITNDIALIKLRHPPSAFTQPGFACLPSENYSPPRDQLCTIVGWGKLKNTHFYGSNLLQEAHVPVVRHRKCERVFDYVITQKQVCAGYKKGGKDSCAGDSGGPLLCSWEDGHTTKYVIYGVTSYGEGCGRKGKYGIYTKVASYRDWIDKTISENS